MCEMLLQVSIAHTFGDQQTTNYSEVSIVETLSRLHPRFGGKTNYTAVQQYYGGPQQIGQNIVSKNSGIYRFLYVP